MKTLIIKQISDQEFVVEFYSPSTMEGRKYSVFADFFGNAIIHKSLEDAKKWIAEKIYDNPVPPSTGRDYENLETK